jgi:SAM-dependent methyltransferase
MKRDDWNRRYEAAELVWSAGPNRFLVSELSDLPPGRALDLACGEGRNAIWLAERGWQVTAVDYSDVAVEKGRRIAERRGVEVDFRVGDLLEHDLGTEAYDLVIVFYLQLPADELHAVLGRAARALAAGGTFLLVGHDLRNLTGGHGGPKDAAVLYRAEDVPAALEGLEVVRAEPVERPVEAEGAVAIDALVRATRPARGRPR